MGRSVAFARLFALEGGGSEDAFLWIPQCEPGGISRASTTQWEPTIAVLLVRVTAGEGRRAAGRGVVVAAALVVAALALFGAGSLRRAVAVVVVMAVMLIGLGDALEMRRGVLACAARAASDTHG